MPHHKSAAKRLKTAEKSRRRNLVVKSAMRKRLKLQRNASEGEAQDLLPGTHSELDRAAQKGVIPKRRAARLKSRASKAASKTS